MDSSINPLMPPAKQQRILIWRNEVASALSTNPAPSLASSHTSTSLSSGIPDDLDPPSPNAHIAPSPSRPRSLWKRLSSRFTGRSRHSGEMGPQIIGSEGGERTAMYRNEAAAQARLAAEEGGEAVGLGEKSSDGGGRGLKEKQERLRRAARLLNQGGSRRE